MTDQPTIDTDKIITTQCRLGELAYHLDHCCTMLKDIADELHALRDNLERGLGLGLGGP
ncbi:MAG TPA: hypothetical protein VMQ38_15030 [Mycobacterium sp.]|jgi:hypothetical protein|nr:hypothetical protein [Mycobacterium sp.]